MKGLMEGEVTILVGLSVDGDPGRYIVPDSIQHPCNDCGTEVWVAPSGQQIIRERAATVVCMNCAQVRMNKEPGSLKITKNQVEEIQAWRKRN